MWRWGRKKSVRALKKQAALTGGLFISVIGVFIGGNFRVPRRWLSAGDGSALFGNERICTVSALEQAVPRWQPNRA